VATPLELSKVYRVVTVEFLAKGGDNIFQSTGDVVPLIPAEEVLERYINATSPATVDIASRIVALKGIDMAN